MKKYRNLYCAPCDDANDKYFIYLDNNFDKVVDAINIRLNSQIPELKKRFISLLRSLFTSKPLIHYEWYDDGCSYDYSGDITERGYINPGITFGELLEEYNGEREASYCSGCGWFYKRFSDNFSDISNEFVSDIICDTIFDCLHAEFQEDDLDDTLGDDYFELYYAFNESSDALLFSESEEVAEKMNIAKIKVSSLIGPITLIKVHMNLVKEYITLYRIRRRMYKHLEEAIKRREAQQSNN